MKKSYVLNTGEIVDSKPRFQTRSCHITPIFHFHGEDKAQQQFKDECDINNIMKRFDSTGQLPDLIKQDPQYGDFTEVPTYLEARQILLTAESQFAALSSKIRARFDNDPSQFLAFATDPANRAEMVQMGLATLPPTTPEPSPQKVIIVNSEASGEPSSPKSKTTPKE